MEFSVFGGLFTNVWAIFLVIVFFGGSIFIHELGHFWAAKRRGLKIERFSIGFGPKLFGWKKDGIEYRVSLLPLGGYVALPQLADMEAIEGKSKDKEQLPPISYADKMIVSVMGVVFNLIFAFILAIILWWVGQPSTKSQLTTVVGYVPEIINLDMETEIESPAKKAGIMAGDKILAIDGYAVEQFRDIQQNIVTGTSRTEDGRPSAIIQFERNGEVKEVVVEPELVQFNIVSKDRMRTIGIAPEQSLRLGYVMENSPAEQAGLKPGDILLSVNGEPLYSLKALSDVITTANGDEVTVGVERDGQELTLGMVAEKIPYTKPMGLITTLDENKRAGSLKVLPMYEKGLKSGLTNPTTPAELMIFEDPPAMSYFEGIEAGDYIRSINGTPIGSLASLTEAIDEADNLVLMMEREGVGYRVEIEPEKMSGTIMDPKTQALIGVQLSPEPVLVYIDPITQFKNNITMTFRTLGSLLHRGSDLSVSQLMGPPGILRVLHTFSTEDLRLLIWFVILLNINLAILNLLPLPVLDGGHMMYATIGKLRGKPLPGEFVAMTQGVFMLLLFSLMLYVSFFDVRRWQGDNKLEAQVKRQKALYIPTQFNGK